MLLCHGNVESDTHFVIDKRFGLFFFVAIKGPGRNKTLSTVSSHVVPVTYRTPSRDPSIVTVTTVLSDMGLKDYYRFTIPWTGNNKNSEVP